MKSTDILSCRGAPLQKNRNKVGSSDRIGPKECDIRIYTPLHRFDLLEANQLLLLGERERGECVRERERERDRGIERGEIERERMR